MEKSPRMVVTACFFYVPSWFINCEDGILWGDLLDWIQGVYNVNTMKLKKKLFITAGIPHSFLISKLFIHFPMIKKVASSISLW